MVTINEEFVSNEQVASEQQQHSDQDQHHGSDPHAEVPVQSTSPAENSTGNPPADDMAHQSASDEQPKSAATGDRAPESRGTASSVTPESPSIAAPRRASTSTAAATLVKLLPQMEAVSRVLSIPVVESGVGLVADVYSKVKNSNAIVHWGLGTAEGSVLTALGTSKTILTPLSKPFSGPLSVVDALLCRGLDAVEYNVPMITLPPELIVSAGRDYVSMRVLQPVLRLTATNAKFADALASKALDSADSYVDRYLPGDAAAENGDAGCSSADKMNDAFHRADRLSRKLQRRLTKRTLAEARAFRKHGIDTVQTLLQFAELLVKDPKAFVEQCQQVWIHLSENEPENQVPPSTLEERLALLIREVARRVVHLTNYTASSCSPLAATALKSVQLEGARVLTFARTQLEKIHVNQILGDLSVYTHQLLERLAHLLAGLRSSAQSRGQHLLHAGTNNIAIVN